MIDAYGLLGYTKGASKELCRWFNMDYISRHMEERIVALSKNYSAILLTGPRQSGKTTMLRELAKKEGIGRR